MSANTTHQIGAGGENSVGKDHVVSFAAETTSMEKQESGLVLKPLFDCDFNFANSNCVALGERAWEALFPDSGEDKPRYVSIANCIYKAVIRHTKDGENPKYQNRIFLNSHQWDDVQAGDSVEIPVYAFDPGDANVPELTSMKVRVKLETVADQVVNGGPVKLYENELTDHLMSHELKDNPYQAPGAQFYIPAGSIGFSASLSDLAFVGNDRPQLGAPVIFAGKVTENTEIEFESASTSQLQIMKEAIKPEQVEQYTFKVKVREHDKQLTTNLLKPVVLDLADLTDELIGFVGSGKKIGFNQSWKFTDKTSSYFFVFDSAKVDQNRIHENVPAEMNALNTGNREFEFSGDPNSIFFSYDKASIQLVDKKRGELPIERAKIEIDKIDGVLSTTAPLFVPADVFEEKLRKIDQPLVCKSQVGLYMGINRFQVRFQELQSGATTHDRQRTTVGQPWRMGEETQFEIVNRTDKRVVLVENKEPKIAKEVVFSIKLKDPDPKKDPTVTEEYLIEEAKKKFTTFFEKGVIFGSQVEVTDKKGFKYDVVIQEMVLEDGTKIRGRGTKYHTLCTFGDEAAFKVKPQGDLHFRGQDETFDVVEDVKRRLKDAKIGGLTSQMEEIAVKILLSRGKLSKHYSKLGLKSIKGILFYGPPGTGKTTTARALAKLLRIKEDNVQQFSATKILSMWLGGSEANLRKYFEPSIKDWEENGVDADQHIIIIDEIDGIGGKRSGRDQKHSAQIINELLTLIDGLDEQGNLVVVGITNRMDMLDDALIRPGRLELQLEIKEPDKAGRKEIFEVHLKDIIENGVLADDVDLDKLAEKTEGATGAVIESIVKQAVSESLNRLIKVLGVDDDENTDYISKYPDESKVHMKDFEKAMKNASHEVPAFVRHMFT